MFVIKKRISEPPVFENICKRSFRHYDCDKFSTRLCDLDWTVLDVIDDVNLAWNMLYTGLLIEADSFCPFKEFKVKKNRPLWYNGQLCELGRERDILLRNYRRTGSSNDDLLSELSQKRKEFNRAVKEAKRNYYNQQITQNRSDPKTFWNLLDELLGEAQSKLLPKFIFRVPIFYVRKRTRNQRLLWKT